MEKSYWEKEEFEDLVAKALLSLYENEMQKECRKVPKFIKPTDKDMLQLRNFGLYFVPSDRCVNLNEIDLINDGLPREAAWSYDPTKTYQGVQKEDLIEGEYLRLGYLRLVDQTPPGVLTKNGLKYFGNHKLYKFLNFASTNNHGFHIMKSYVSIDENGTVHDTYGRDYNGKLTILAHGSIKKPNREIISDVDWTSAVIGLYQDRRYLWNVTANEGRAKATFGIYPDEVKSLFYAREMPMSETGRKRPILHWVAAHHRRLKNGIDVDIEKHLRGINEFVYQGTKFTISRPIKERRG